jgi:hypothetical protein
LANRRTLHFSIYKQDNEAQIFGSLEAMGLSDMGLRLTVDGIDQKAPSLGKIVDQLAHEMLRKYLAQDTKNKLELLDPAEFFNLADVIVYAAQANRRVIGGRAASTDFAKLVPQITVLADRVPDWPELDYLAAWIADSANDADQALKYYQKAVPLFRTAKNFAVVDSINVRISALTRGSGTLTDTAPLPTTIDYTSEIKIRDSGAEGSVVGQALASALEFQISKATHESPRISARFLYYAARKTGGLNVDADTGAQIKDGIKVLEHDGAVKESVWPYSPGKFGEKPPPDLGNAERFRIRDARQLSTLRDVKLALENNGPVVMGITVFEGMMNQTTAKSGIVPLPRDKELVVGGHAIVIVGYDDNTKRVKFANSWGTMWGVNGFGYLPYEYVEKYMTDAWTFKFASA